MTNFKIIFSFFYLIIVSGCTNVPKTTENNISIKPVTSDKLKQKLVFQKVKQKQIRKKLLAQYSEWQGVPYQLGGLSKKGVDCSGFVYLTFRQQFNRKLARSTQQMIHAGVKISKSKLQIGDLIFFKTPGSKRHVGIYLGADEFMHASTSQGVMISYLSNPYWSSHYWFASRQ